MSVIKIINGLPMKNEGGVCWCQNLKQLHYKSFKPNAIYNPENYPVYDNYNAVEVGTLKKFPKDYNGVMGVPVTYLFKIDPDSFEMLDLVKDASVNGQRKYYRLLIRRRGA